MNDFAGSLGPCRRSTGPWAALRKLSEDFGLSPCDGEPAPLPPHSALPGLKLDHLDANCMARFGL